PLLRSVARGLSLAGMERFERYATLVDVPFVDYYLSRTATPFTPFNVDKEALYTPRLSAACAGRANPPRSLLAHVRDESLLNQMLYVDTKTWLPDDLLLKADKMSMACS